MKRQPSGSRARLRRAHADHTRRQTWSYRVVGFGSIALLAIGSALLMAVVASEWPPVLLWPLVSTPFTFLFYWFDKHQAQGSGARVPEVILLLLALGGGFIGGFLAMKQLRHKTRHLSFWLAQGVGLAIWIGLAWWLLGK